MINYNLAKSWYNEVFSGRENLPPWIHFFFFCIRLFFTCYSKIKINFGLAVKITISTTFVQCYYTSISNCHGSIKMPPAIVCSVKRFVIKYQSGDVKLHHDRQQRWYSTLYLVGYQIAEMLHDWYIVFQAPYK